MGGALSWIRGSGGGLSERKKAMASAKERIGVLRSELGGFKSAHYALVSRIVKLLVVLEVALGAWFWAVRDQTQDVLRMMMQGAPLVAWPLLCWLVKRVVDWYYQLRIRRGESRLEALYGEQKKILKEIESDPDFQERLELLKEHGKDIPGYRTPFASEASSRETTPIKARPPPPPSGDGMIQRGVAPRPGLAPPPTLSGSPASKGAEGAQVSASAPSTPAPTTYVQPVMRPPPSLGRKGGPTRISGQEARAQEGGFFSRMIDIMVGEGIQLSVPLDCVKCGVNNGLISQEEAAIKKSFVCSHCKTENTLPPLKNEN